jgi:hypothetical protein
VAVDLIVRAQHGTDRVGVPELNGDRVELVAPRLPELALGGDLQEHGLRRDLHRRDGNPILLREVGERLHVGIAGDEQHRRTCRAGEALHLALGAIPDQQEVRRPAGDEIDVARHERLDRRAAAREGNPVDLDVAEPCGRGVLLDQLVLLHQDHGHVDHARLMGDADLLDLRGRGMGEAERQKERAGGACDEFHEAFPERVCVRGRAARRARPIRQMRSAVNGEHQVTSA